MINIADIPGSMSRILRDVAICGSLVSNLSVRAQQSLSDDTYSSEIAQHIYDFQQETGVSDTSMALLVDLFGLEELEKVHSPLRLKFAIIYQTLLTHPHTSYSAIQILDAIVLSFAEQYTHLSKEEKILALYDIIGSLDEFVIEFLLDFYYSDKSSQDSYMSVEGQLSGRLRSMLGSNTDDPSTLLTVLSAVSGEIAEEKNKPIEPFVLTKDVDDRLIHTHFQRPEVKLYLRYKAATLDFPNKDIVAALRHKKNLDQDMFSDVDVIANWDIVPFSVRQQMKIRGGSRSDLELLEQFKKFHYQTFSSLVGKDISDIDTWLLRLFHALQKTLPKQETKYAKVALKNNQEFSLLPRTTETIAAMLCHAIIHESDKKRPKSPDYNEIAVLVADINTASDQLSQLRDVTQDLHFHNQELSRQQALAVLKAEQSQLLSLMVDNLVYTIEHPKGGFDVQYVLTDKYRMGDEITMCGRSSCLTLRNIVKAGGIEKQTEYLRPSRFDKIEQVIADGKIPVLRGDVIEIYNALKKHNLGEVISGTTPQELFDKLKKELPYLAVKHNNSVFEMYFNTSGMVTIVDKETGEKKRVYRTKAHRTHFALGPDGNRQIFDPYYNPAIGISKRKGFSPEVFFDKMSQRVVKSKKENAYQVIINTAIQYGYLAEDIISTLAHGSQLLHNPEVRDIFAAKNVGLTPEDLEQYQDFIPEGLTYSAVNFADPHFDDLEKVFPYAAYELLESIFLQLEEISNPFVKAKIMKYLRAGDVRGLQLEFNPDGEPTGILDDSILELIREESYNNLNEKKYKGTVGVDMGYTGP